MSIPMSKAVQRAAVAEGMALGVIAVRGEGFTFNAQKMTIKFAFQHAWRDWAYQSSFPAVRAQIDRNDLLGIIDDHPRQRSSAGLTGWASSWPFEPYIRGDYDVEEVGKILQDGSGVPLSGWIDLARHFLDDLETRPRPQQP